MKKSLFFLILMAITFASFAQVGINTDGSSPDPSAMLDVKSDTAGILIPRMTATQRDAINNPAQGLMVFVTDDNTFYYYSDTGWAKFSSGENGWIASGNYVYNADAKIGIGTTSPVSKLHIHDYINDTTLIAAQYGGGDEVKISSYILNANGGSGVHYGTYNHMMGSGTGPQTGAIQVVANTGNGYHYGTYNILQGSGTGNQFGTYQEIYNSENGKHYGSFNKLTGSGTGNKYGTFDTIASTAGGTHYGVYSVAEGAGNYAGYFKGNVRVTERISAPTSGADADLKPYIYGSLKNTDGSYYTLESTDGFTSTRESTGVYKITFDSYNSDKYYLVIANALRTSGPVILTYEKNNGYFKIRAWNLSGTLVDTYLNFVVYKK